VPADSPPRSEYRRRLDRWANRIAGGERRSRLISNLRLADAALAAAVLWLAIARGISPAWLLLPAVAFLVLVVVHARVLMRLDRAGRARRFYARGMDRLDARWIGTGGDGARFLEGHLFARDLDLFGTGSLFQLMNTARTEAGEETLAGWLGAGAAVDEIRARQSAVEELRPKLDFREDVAVLADEAHIGRTSALERWVATEPAGLSGSLAVAFGACAAVASGLGIAALADRVNPALFWLWFVIESCFVRIWWRRIKRVLTRIDTPAHDLELLSGLLARIEREPFSSPRLSSLHETLTSGGLSASEQIGRLERLVSILYSATKNQFFVPFSYLLLVPAQVAVAIDRWHTSHGPAIAAWLRAVGEIEALSSIAAYAYEHPDDPFPVFADGGPIFDGRAIGHPLIADAISVPNDVRIGGNGPRVLIVSGSNMSGKSTLLRSVGVNVVLALAGAPVRALGIRLSQLQLGATLKIEDSLQAGQSRFYAEILRIRSIVGATAEPIPVLFLLDEILHGTNSHDRRIGAEAIVATLVRRGAIGLVTTHDLALTELATTLGSAAANVHFEDRIENGAMVFDYRMRPGVVEKSNALELMRGVGLDV
jgi:hypothetical protein